MTSDRGPLLDIRVGMDVYNAYQDEYIGTVIEVWRSAPGIPGATASGNQAKETGSDDGAVESPHLQHEEGEAVQPTGVAPAGRKLGEDLGPFPTTSFGNTGPAQQSASADYATGKVDPKGGVYLFSVRPGRLNLGVLTPQLFLPTSIVDSISMERVVVRWNKDDL